VKGLLLAILATLVGVAMVGGGIYGIVKDTEDDDDSSTTISTPVIPDIESSVGTDFERCAEASARDSRLGSIDNVVMRPAGGETGDVTIRQICNGETVVLQFNLEGLRTKETSSYHVWFYKGKRRARQVGSLIGSDGRAFGSATITTDVDTQRYDFLVISQVDFGQSENRPRRIRFRGTL
jgi:hypothetical protein